MDDPLLICYKCQADLVRQKANFSYLGHLFSAEVLACPNCHQAYVPESLAKGKMAETETLLEDK